MQKKNIVGYSIVPLFVIFLYILLASQPIPEEISLEPHWIVDITTLPAQGPETTTSQEVEPFKSGAFFGYIGLDGKGGGLLPVSGSVSYSRTWWIDVVDLSRPIILRNPFRTSQIPIEQVPGYPFFLEDHLFFIDEEQRSLFRYTEDGKFLWLYAFPGICTGLSHGTNRLVAGTLEGLLVVLDSTNGKELYRFEPGGSRFPVILSSAISKNDTYIVLIAGLEPQRFLVLEQFKNTYKVLYHRYLPSNYRRPVWCIIVKDEWVLYEQPEGIGIFNLFSKKFWFLPFPEKYRSYRIQKICGTEHQGIVGMLLSQEKNHVLMTIRLPDIILGIAPYEGGETNLTTVQDTFYLSSDTRFISFSFTEGH
ncbi:MAG: hypothetical protein N2Z76_03970 [Treponemataceae bacterium]|nr:hypothetical protein [Treponemataceae bacterium]